MKYGVLFNKMRNFFPVLSEIDFSSNKFSGLTRKELNTIAHELYEDNAWGDRGNYTHMTNADLAMNCYDCVKEL